MEPKGGHGSVRTETMEREMKRCNQQAEKEVKGKKKPQEKC